MANIRMTVGQALVRFLDNQYILADGREEKFVDGIFTIFGHGIVCGLGQALAQNPGELKVYQGRNEQGMAHTATAFAKQHNRRKIIACASSIGPGAANMVTAVALASVNNLPLLVFTGDAFATRQPDPVLQQLEQPYDLSITTSDAFRPVSRYWDRVHRPEQLMSALINAMRVLTDGAMAGGVCISLPQDVQAEAYDFPESFLAKRVHRIARPLPDENELQAAAERILQSKKPLVVCGGGVRYSEAGKALANFCSAFGIPLAETQAGKSAVASSHPLNLGGVGVTGNSAANQIAREADLVLGIGTRFSDFTTGSKEIFSNPGAGFIALNLSRYHAEKMDALPLVADARETLLLLQKLLAAQGYRAAWQSEIEQAKAGWEKEMQRLAAYRYAPGFEPLVAARNPRSIEEFVALTGGVITQTAALALIRQSIEPNAIVVGASGSLPGDLQRMWTTDEKDAYHMEYGYSCMGYEIAGALGAKLASPQTPVYSMVGDGSFMMLHSEMATARQEGQKITILLFDNCGFGCINNLQMSSGIPSLATEFRARNLETGKQDGPLLATDFAAIAKGYGYTGYTAKTMEELQNALTEAKAQPGPILIDIKALPKTMTDGYGSWWHVGLAETGTNPAEKQAYADGQARLETARKY